MSQAGWIALGGSRLSSLLPSALSLKEEWENARLKLLMVTWVTGIKAVFHGGIDPLQTCPLHGFHRSSISLNSNKKEIFSLCTNQHYFGEVEECVCQQRFPYKLLMPFSKGEGRWFQARRRLADRISWGLLWNFTCDPLAVRNGLGFIFIFREVQIDPLITCKVFSRTIFVIFVT